MKTIILVRHAKASSKGLPIPDKDRPLRKRGKKDLKLMKPALVKQKTRPEHIFSSSANRAAQTATVVAGFYEMCDRISFFDELYHPDSGGVLDFIRSRDDALDIVMVVGHNPELSVAADILRRGTSEAPMPTSACLCMSFDTDSWDDVREGGGNVEYFEYPGKYK